MPGSQEVFHQQEVQVHAILAPRGSADKSVMWCCFLEAEYALAAWTQITACASFYAPVVRKPKDAGRSQSAHCLRNPKKTHTLSKFCFIAHIAHDGEWTSTHQWGSTLSQGFSLWDGWPHHIDPYKSPCLGPWHWGLSTLSAADVCAAWRGLAPRCIICIYLVLINWC